MKSALAWLAVSAFFVAINVLAAYLMLGIVTVLRAIDPLLADVPLIGFAAALAAIAGAVWVACVSVRPRFIGR